MKSIKSKKLKNILWLIAIILPIAIGLYIIVLISAPTIAPTLAQPIDISKLPPPAAQSEHDQNRIIIPKIGVDIVYATDGQAALDRGALWNHPDRGNPEKGGNFIIAAHRFSIQPTPTETVKKSPFYNIDKLVVDDQIYIDYAKKRYLYTIQEIITVRPTQVEIEAPSEEAKLTLYSCELGGADAGRIVMIAKPVGVKAEG